MNPQSPRPISAAHPIAIEPSAARVIVRAGGQEIANSARALKLREADYPAVIYIPRADVNMSLFERSPHRTHCPYKGDASYFSLPNVPNAAWSYETPYDQVSTIAGHLAFYPDRVDEIQERETSGPAK